METWRRPGQNQRISKILLTKAENATKSFKFTKSLQKSLRNTEELDLKILLANPYFEMLDQEIKTTVFFINFRLPSFIRKKVQENLDSKKK